MAELTKYDLNEIPWTDIAASIKAGNDTVMIPVGSLEKHGHHVPLGVDSYTTMGSVELAAGDHELSVEFTNDEWAGPGGEDRNLYLMGAGFAAQ